MSLALNYVGNLYASSKIAAWLQNIRNYDIDTLNLHVWILCAFSGRTLVSRSNCIDYTGNESRHEPTACAS